MRDTVYIGLFAAMLLLTAATTEAQESRQPGSPGNLAMEQRVSTLFSNSGLVSGEMKFTAPCFESGSTLLTIAGSQPVQIFAMHPTLFRPGNFKEDNFSGNVVYLGSASDADIASVTGVSLKHALILLDFNCGFNWTRLLRFGPEGFIFIEPDTYTPSETWSKVYATEVSVPRFLIRAGDAARLKTAASTAPSIPASVSSAPCVWKNITLRNLWCIIPGSDERLAREAVVILAPLDSNSIVPELAPGAQAAANLDLLLSLFESFKSNPPARTVVLAAVNAHTRKYLGERILAWNLLMPGDAIDRMNDLIQKEAEDQERSGLKSLAELNRRELAVNTANQAIRKAMAGRRIALVLSLDLNWRNDKTGFTTGDFWGAQKWQYGFGRNSMRIASRLSGSSTQVFVDTLTNPSGLPEGYFFPSMPGGAVIFQYAANTPAFSLANVFADAGPSFSPADTHSSMNTGSVEMISNHSRRLIRAILDDSSITRPSELPKPPFQQLWSTRISAFEFDRMSAAVMPSIPVAGAAIILHDSGAAASGPDVEGAYLALTDERATCTFYGLNKVTARAPVFTAAFHFDPVFRNVDRAVDAGDAHERVTSSLNRADQLILSLFPCTEIPLLDRADPALLSARPVIASEYIVLDGQLNSYPRRYGATGISLPASGRKFPQMSGPAAVYIVPGTRSKIMTRQGRLLINAGPQQPEGTGFEPAAIDSDFFFASTRDMKIINEARASAIKGAPDRLSAEFMKLGAAKLSDATAASASNNHVAFLSSLSEATGAEAKAYQHTSARRNDMLKAVVLYMALLIPFCFFLQRLLFSTPRIEFQMLLFTGLFIGTYLVFRLIHPAFLIARSPETLFIAFIMGALGLFVIFLLHGRFEGEMRLLFSNSTGAAGSDIGFSSAGQQAVMIGVNNMKRRRIRTTLTTATIVLVTFTMLAFSSISRTQSPTMIMKSSASPYTGLMYHWPGRPMDEQSLNIAGELLSGSGETVVRRWLLAPRSEFYAEQLVLPFHVSAGTGSTINIEALLGLPVAEDGFIARIPMVAGRFFKTNDALEVILPLSTARALNLSTGDVGRASVELNARTFTVAGIVEDATLHSLVDLDGKPVIPVKSTNRRITGDTSAAADGTQTDEDSAGVTLFDTSSLMIIPLDTCRTLGGQPYSISAKLPSGETLWHTANRILNASSARFYIGSSSRFAAGSGNDKPVPPGVYYIGSGYRTSIGGLSRLIIPLLIAATILFNTMLGAVYERKREVAIYNAIGLNPTHIGLFFLAEALVYSVIGSVGGYLIGQLSALGLEHLGLAASINLNFSSLTVGYVIVFTILVVLLSTIYPAIMASRAAVPSGKRSWAMPANDGNTMNTVFPFIYQPAMLKPALNYLREYFAGFSGAATGGIIAEELEFRVETGTAGHDRAVLVYTVALPPYDLGVTQSVSFTGSYDGQLGFCRISLSITRISGQDSNWATINRDFLEKLRRHLMNWRNLSEAEQNRYLTFPRG